MTIIYGNRDPSGPAVQDVAVQDQITDTVIVPLAYTKGRTTLAVQGVPDAYTIVVDSATGMSVGDHIRIVDTVRYYLGTILGISGTTITVDNPVDFEYPVGAEVTYNTINLAVDGSVTPAHYHLRTGDPSISGQIDIVRMIMVCECSGAVDLNKFGDITGGLTRGLTFRISNGHLRNIWNVKTNRDLVSLAYDWTPFSASNPAQGINGFSWRLTFGSQGKMGVVLRVNSDGQLGLLVQDDLSSLDSLICIVEGHVVD